MKRNYYEEEMRYLAEAGRAFAQAHPDRARFLNIDAVEDRDPFVERLFEGIAFLNGRIHERLDDEFPEVTDGLFSLINPHYLKPFPSVAILELKPVPGLVSGVQAMPRLTEVRSEPVGRDSVVCRFATSREVKLLPISLTDARAEWTTDGRSEIQLTLQAERGVKFSDLDLSPLRLYFNADAALASTMYYYLTHCVDSVHAGGTSRISFVGGQEKVTAVGFDKTERLVPDAPGTLDTFSEFRLLQEYLCFRRAFWFVDLHGLDVGEADESGKLIIKLGLTKPYPEDPSKRFDATNVKLFCTPVVNLFDMQAEPIRAEHRVTEYRVAPSQRNADEFECYDILEVEGLENDTGIRHNYHPYFKFLHSREGNGSRYHVATTRAGAGPTTDTYIALGDSADGDEAPRSETLSVTIRATNASIPRELLREGMIRNLAPGKAQIVQPDNLTQPSLIWYPPTGKKKEYFWQLLSTWSFNYLTVSNRDALASMLELYDWTTGDANKKRIAGILQVNWKPAERIYRGGILRGAEVTIEIKDGHFADEGDVSLFGSVLSKCLSQYASINSFVDLQLETTPSGRVYEWRAQDGKRAIF